MTTGPGGRRVFGVGPRLLGVAASAALALGCAAGSLWIEGKAVLAQLLFDRAWSATGSARDHVRPWPWADTWPVARLSVPRLDRRWIVLAGASGRTLAFGPGHVDGTALPGEAGHAVVAGHRDTQFAALRDLRLGDTLVVETASGREARYRVTETTVLDTHDVASLRPHADDTLTLVTCWPFDAVVPGGTQRYVVEAELRPQARGTMPLTEAPGVEAALIKDPRGAVASPVGRKGRRT